MPKTRIPALMVQGTGSDVGKSVLLAGLARIFSRRGLRVYPFKPQNMSNNAAAVDGGEIGRAQALQARAAGVPPCVDMNPVLLKPHSEHGAQIIVHGRAVGTSGAREYRDWCPRLLRAAVESFDRLAAMGDLILVEGAGGSAEVNLRDRDIANMGFAEAADVPVVLVGDIERGGVIASLVGTVSLLSKSERARLGGFIVNKFRGDQSLFDEGVRIIEARTGLSCLGVVPYLDSVRRLPAEDTVALDEPPLGDPAPSSSLPSSLRVVVPRLPRIANFDDLDPLSLEAGVSVEIVEAGSPLPAEADVIFLPGSKSTRSDLDALRRQGWDIDLYAHVRRGGWVLGLCGGYQMLGRSVGDPLGLEGPPGDSKGLGLLDVDTVLETTKIVRDRGDTVRGGYEIHAGRTTGPDCARPFTADIGGAVSADGRVMGCYMHGLFADDRVRRGFLARLGRDATPGLCYEAVVEATLDHWADHVAAHLDCDLLWTLARSRS